MARIAGVNIPVSKRVDIGLTAIYGIGRVKAVEVCNKIGIDRGRRVSTLTEDEVIRIREAIAKEYMVEGDLRRAVSMNIKNLKEMKCYRGIRHIRKLPVRGQSTHSNARTRKGKAVAIAGKKK